MAEKEITEIIPGYSTIDDFIKEGFKTLIEATKASNALPSNRNWNFYKLHDSFSKIMQDEGGRILKLLNTVLHVESVSANISNKNLDEKIEILIDANDEILEKVARGIDEMNGIKKNAPEAIKIQAVTAQLPVNGSWNQLSKGTFSVTSSISTVMSGTPDSLKSVRLITAMNILRPQSFFKDKIDNRNVPWEPRIKEKPNSLKPLAIFLEETENGEAFSHPYDFELERFTPPIEQLQITVPVLPKKPEEVPFYEISTVEELDDLVDELRNHTEFAVDLEHHSYRTFLGITCLMQISTKDADYIIDTLSLRHKLYVLNEVFTKPSIVKVFHGADMDIEWLQRDLSLYVVNMFDTHQAAKRLGYPRLSLAYLVNSFCNVTLNKQFQLADWRIRPLPDELKTYARFDTHFLLYIYKVLKNKLLLAGNGNNNILRSVIQQSTQICLKRYIKPILREDSYLEFYRKSKRMFDNKQMYALKELYNWRDNIARIEDESTGFVLPNHMLLQIAETLPREMQGILACCNPIPLIVRSNLLELHRIILKAREQPTIKPILKEDTRSRGSTLEFNKVNINHPLHSPHDLSKMTEFRDDLPTLLGGTLPDWKASDKDIPLESVKSVYSIFNTPENSSDEGENEAVLNMKDVTFLTPYERYKLVKPFIQASEQEKETVQDKSEEKSTEDRIAALHTHFVQISKEIPQIIPDTIQNTDNKPQPVDSSVPENVMASYSGSLVSMGGSKKRKRTELEGDDSLQLHQSSDACQNELLTPIPRWKKNRNNQKGRYYKKLKLNQQNQAVNERGEDQQVNKNQGKQQSRNQQKKFKFDRNQSNTNTFQPFDYSSVNFQQFQGNAGTANPKPNKKRFRNRNRNKKINKNSNNKSMTFNRFNN